MLEKKTFTSAFKNSRCLVPITGWYEWKEEEGIKQPYYFSSNSSETLIAAGLYWNRSSGDIESSIITREAVGDLQTVHNRSPLLLNKEKRDLWISEISSEEIYAEILDYSYSDIKFYKVDRAVNNPKNNKNIILKNIKRIKYPEFYKILITKPIMDELDLSVDLPILKI